MSNTIEQIKSQVFETRSQIEQSRNLSPEEKMQKARELEGVMVTIKTDLNKLKVNATTEKLKEIESVELEYKKLENELKSFKGELDDIQRKVIDENLNNLDNEVDSKIGVEPEGSQVGDEESEVEDDKPSWRGRNKKTVLIGAGTLGVGLLIRRWWKKRKEKKEGNDKPPRYKKRWGIGLIGIGGISIRKNWDGIKEKVEDLWNWLTGKKKETEPGDEAIKGNFDSLSDPEKQKYFDLSTNIENFGENHSGYFNVSLSDKDDKDKYFKARSIHTLDKEIGNLSSFGSDKMFDFMVKQSTDDFLDKIRNWTKEKIHNFLGPYLQSLESFQPFGTKFISKPAEAIKERLQGGVDREEKLQHFLKHNLNIVNYVTEKRRVLKEKIAKEQIMGMGRLKEEPNEKEQKSIDKLLGDDNREKTVFLSKLSKYTLSNFSILLNEYDIGVNDISKETEYLNNELEEEKNNAFSIDEDGETCISRAKTEFLDGSLSENTREELIHLCDWLLEDISGNGNSGNKNFIQAYTYLITDLFKGDEKYAEQFSSTLRLPELQKEIETKLESTKNKLKNNTFVQEDLHELETQANSYMEVRDSTESINRCIDEYSNSGFKFNWEKLLALPLNAIKSIGKAFDSENSWWSRIGYGLGGLYVSGQTLYIASKFPIPGAKLIRIGGKTAIKIGQIPIEVGKVAFRAISSFRAISGRRFLFGYSWSRYINNPALSFAEKNRMLRYAYLKGEIGNQRAMNIAESIGSHTITGVDDLLKSFGITDPAHIEVYKNYGRNKNMRKLLFKSDRVIGTRPENILRYNITQRTLGRNLKPDLEAFNKLAKIHSELKTYNQETKLFWEHFLKNTKTLNNVDKLMTGPEGKYLLNLSKSSSNDLKFAKTLARSFHKYPSLDDFNSYLKFLDAQKSSITNFDQFVSNTMHRGTKIIKMTPLEQNKLAQSPKLNSSFLDRRINWMKDNFRKSATKIKEFIPKSPYAKNLTQTAENLNVLAKTDNETIKLLQNADNVGRSKRLNAASKHKTFFSETSNLLKADANFAKALSKAKNSEEIKKVFARFYKNVPKDLPDEFLQQISKTKSTKKIMDTFKYAEKYDELNKITKVLKHPSMKYASRVLGRVLVVGAIAGGGFSAYSTYQEGTRLIDTNESRGKLKQNEALYDIGLTLAGACAFIPGVGWVASGLILAGTLVGGYTKEAIFGTLDKYNKNYKDLIGDSPLVVKQHIITTILGGDKKERSFKETITRIFHDKQLGHLAGNTTSEATKALLYLDEWKDNPLAMVNIQDTQLMERLEKEDPPITRTMVAEAIDKVEDNVKKRYDFLEDYLGTVNYTEKSGETTKHLNINKALDKSTIKNYRGINKIDQILLASKFNLHNPDEFKNYQDVENKGKVLGKELAKDKDSFNKLENLFNKDIRSLAYLYRYSFDFEIHMNDYSIDETGTSSEQEYDKITNNIQYLNNYIQYKSITDGVDFGSLVLEKDDIPNLISIRDFLVDFNLSNSISSTELYGGTLKFQNALYRIATEVLGVTNLSNTKEEILQVFNEAYEHSYGIYFKKGDINRLCINGSGMFGKDREFVLDEGSLSDFKKEIEAMASSGRLVAKGETGKNVLNKELLNRYVKIIDEELNRK